MNAGAHDNSAGRYHPQGQRHHGTDGREYDGGVQRFRWRITRGTRPNLAQRAGKALRGQIAFAGKGIDLPPLPDRDLGDNMSPAPKPKIPSRLGSSAIRRDRCPINPAQSNGAAAVSS